MRFYFRLFFYVATLGVFCATIIAQVQTPQTVTHKFVNGNWFDGKKFKRKTFYSVNGVFTGKPQQQVAETIDLQNGFVIPPLADAHCHHFDGAFNIAQQVEMYLRAGVFYAKVQTDVRSGALEVANRVNKPESVDVSYAHGGLTHTYGHGMEVYEGLVLFYRTGGFTPEQEAKVRQSHLRENDAYYIVDTAADLEKKWPKILAGKPDFIKIYLLSSEDFAEKRQNLANIPLGSIGLDPEIVPLIVQKAHAAGLRVSAHVDTLADFRVALKAGVDEMAHLIGYYIGGNDNPNRYVLTESDVKELVRRKVPNILAPVAYSSFDPKSADYNQADQARTDKVRLQNLRLLRKLKAKLAFGSDRYGNTPVDDVFYLQKLGVFSNLEMLKIWVEDTPQTIFPKRKLGFLKEGYEASFIVLPGDPTKDFAQLKNIKLRFKQGVLLK